MCSEIILHMISYHAMQYLVTVDCNYYNNALAKYSEWQVYLQNFKPSFSWKSAFKMEALYKISLGNNIGNEIMFGISYQK